LSIRVSSAWMSSVWLALESWARRKSGAARNRAVTQKRVGVFMDVPMNPIINGSAQSAFPEDHHSNPQSARMQGCSEALEILRMYANDSAAWAIDLRNQKERDGKGNRQNQKQQWTSLLGDITYQHVAEETDSDQEDPRPNPHAASSPSSSNALAGSSNS
jgi:hypothetical protein